MGNYSPLIALTVPGLALLIVVLVYVRRRQPPARKLGQPYSVNTTIEGWSGTAELKIREGKLCFAFPVVSAGPYAQSGVHAIRVPLTRVRAIRVRDVGIAIDYASLEGPETLVVITREQGAKDRLLWELAVLVPAAVEAGIPAEGPRAAVGATPLMPTGHAAATSEPPDAARAVLDLDVRMASLGSALAGPVDRPPPSPPRSGLGTGLFAAPPLDGDK